MKSNDTTSLKTLAVLIAAMLCIGGSVTVFGVVVSHNTQNNIQCQQCHFQHNSNVAYIARGTEQEARCATCHNPTGVASSKSDVVMHSIGTNSVPVTSNMVDCGSCHEVHGGADTNELLVFDAHLGLIVTNRSYVRVVTNYVPWITTNAVFAFVPTNYAFASNNSPWNGICQVCHTKTARHRNDNSTDNNHKMGQDCMSCHKHNDGFGKSGGGCRDCHSSPQDAGDGPPTRRAVVAEFSLSTHHIMGGGLADEDCAVCHYEAWNEAYHTNNLIDLVNPDNTNVAAVISFTNLVRNTNSAILEAVATNVQFNFCLKCHDAGGATQSYATNNSPTQPFWSGTGTVINIFDAFATTNMFHHAVRGQGSNTFCNSTTMAGPWGGAGAKQITCFDCHSVNGHGSDTNYNLRVQITNTTDTAGIDAFCMMCHAETSYRTGSTGSDFADHNLSGHTPSGSGIYSCRTCHAGQVDGSGGASNGGVYPQIMIHGGNFTWGSGSKTPGVRSTQFLMGGYLSGIDTVSRECYGGNCNHNGKNPKTY